MRYLTLIILLLPPTIHSSSFYNPPNSTVQTHQIGETVSNTINNRTEFTYWYVGKLPGPIDSVTIKVNSSVGNGDTESPVRFDMRWKDFINQAARTWVLPRESNGTVYLQANRTLCSANEYDKLDEIHVKVTVSSSTLYPVNFTLSVWFGESNVISDFNQTRRVDLTLYSPVYFKLKIDRNAIVQNSKFGMLDVWSDDQVCVTLALQSMECPLIERQKDAELGRHLTMCKSASVTIEMSSLLQGRFLIFLIHENDTKCRSDECNGCWKNEILPTDFTPPPTRQKTLQFKLREKITNNQYVFSTVLSTGCFLSLLVIFPIVYCVIKKKRHSRQLTTPSNPSNETELLVPQNPEPKQPEYRFIFFKKHYTPHPNKTPHSPQKLTRAKTRSSHQHFGNLTLNAIFYILPAFQLIMIYQRFYTLTGNEDICYFNFKCLHSLWGFPAFNHVFSNIGYVIMGLVFLIVVGMDVPRGNTGIFRAMGLALTGQGVMSGLYHMCPNQISFQFDTSFMYITAMICVSHIYQKQHPTAVASPTTTYAVVAIAVSLGVAAVLSKVTFFWYGITTVHILICLLVSFQLDSIHGGYTWKLDSPRGKSTPEILSSITTPLTLTSFTPVKSLLLSFNAINWTVAGVGLWMFTKSQDFATYLLILFILNVFLFSIVYLKMEHKNNRLPILTSTLLMASTIPVWTTAFIFYTNATSSWQVSPAESRILNQHCVLFQFFDSHDLWHFLSAFGMFLNFMFFFTLDGSGDGELRRRSIVPVQSEDENKEELPDDI